VSSSSEESSAVEAGSTGEVDGAAEVVGAEEAAGSVAALVDSITCARKAASGDTRGLHHTWSLSSWDVRPQGVSVGKEVVSRRSSA
jgi:hypothetical protein